MDAREFRQEAARGRVSLEELVGRLIDRVEQLETRVRGLEAENKRLKSKLEQYEPPEKAPASGTENFSVDAEAKRRQRKKNKRSPGRRRTAIKVADATSIVELRPEGVPVERHRLVSQRAAWRLIDNRAVLVAYRQYDAPGVPAPPIPCVPARSEHGVEISVVLAFLVYIIRMSQSKACELLRFFCDLPLSRSQADLLLRRLGRDWDGEFGVLCDLLVRAAVVYLDEPGWRVGRESCSLWALGTDLVQVFVFGCRKDDATLDTLLPPDRLQGIGVSDDAAVYSGRFQVAQKCWAHLLRKAIRLCLPYPASRRYRRLLDGLMAIFQDAKRAAADKRLGATGRAARVLDLSNRLCDLCVPLTRDAKPTTPEHERDYLNLLKELVRLCVADELFTFVLHPEVSPTNNESERRLRDPAGDRAAGRTSKTTAGARRRSVIVSVLQSLRTQLETFTLSSTVDEVLRWMSRGVSRFSELLQKLQSQEQPELATETS